MIRLHAASCVDDACCRFCSFEKESLSHPIDDCEHVKQMFGQLPQHEFGENFRLLGIVEHPVAIVKHRLRWSDPQTIIVKPIDIDAPLEYLWTDGSIFWAERIRCCECSPASDYLWISLPLVLVIVHSRTMGNFAGLCIGSIKGCYCFWLSDGCWTMLAAHGLPWSALRLVTPFVVALLSALMEDEVPMWHWSSWNRMGSSSPLWGYTSWTHHRRDGKPSWYQCPEYSVQQACRLCG